MSALIMDDSRINRRMRARSYDLRRKVLLKNFFRDQMNHFPETETNTEPFSHSETSGESSTCDEKSSLQEVEHTLSFATVDDDEPTISNATNDNSDIKQNPDNKIDLIEAVDDVAIDKLDIPVNSNIKPISESNNLVRLTNLFKKNSKGNFKSKKYSRTATTPMKTRSFKKSFEKVFYSYKRLSSNHKNSPRSLFTIFKHRREQRRAKEIDRSMRSSDDHISSSNVPTKNSINQSVQTDDSWVREEMNKVHESNKRLKEENKLLSESLSFFMSNPSNSQLRQSSSPYQPSYRNENSLMLHDYTFTPSTSNQGNWKSRPKVYRSKSVHESSERHKMSRNNYRTKSINVHNSNSRNYFLTNSRPLLPSYTDEANLPRIRKKHIFTNEPNSSNRNIQRRSSMPERTLSENNRWVSHGRSNSMRNTHTRTPFYALSADAFY